MTKNLILLGLMITAISTFTSCDKDDPDPTPTPELITTLTYTLTPSAGGDAVVMRFQDLDGDGGDAATVMNGTLAANTSYSGSMELLNESISPIEDITEEIEEEDEEHQFFFQTTITDLSIAYADQDEDGNPIGLSSTVTTGAAGSGTLTVILKHEPVKSAEGVAGGDITNAQGETDIEVTFSIDVE